MSLHHDAHLVRMVNQIAANLKGGRDDAQAVADICHHLETFWARPMKQSLIAYSEREEVELAPLARRAIQQLSERQIAQKIQADKV
ncbi:formate dehydrogenase subunit delta [Halomonas sediminis]